MVLTRTIFVLATIIIISIPLVHSLYKIKEKINIKKQTNYYLQNIIKSETKDYKIKNLEIGKITDIKIIINSTISIPE